MYRTTAPSKIQYPAHSELDDYRHNFDWIFGTFLKISHPYLYTHVCEINIVNLIFVNAFEAAMTSWFYFDQFYQSEFGKLLCNTKFLLKKINRNHYTIMIRFYRD